jgi:dipeptide/tripeptide permease
MKEIMETALSAKSALKYLGLYLIFLILFYACEEQLGSTLILFSERYLDRATALGTIPAASIIMINPLAILLSGTCIYKILQKYPLTGTCKVAISFAFLSTAFWVLNIGCYFGKANETVNLGYGLGSIFLIGVGELFIGPTVFAIASKAAPRNLMGLTMGMVTLGYALANLASGFLSQLMAVSEEAISLDIYARGFSVIGWIALVPIAFLFKINQQQKVSSC